MEEALVGYVDVDAMKTLTASYMWVLQKYAEVHLPALFDVLTAPDPAVAGAVATTYMDGFMTGVEFQIAGGHREVDA
jgi:hypothetical protein